MDRWMVEYWFSVHFCKLADILNNPDLTEEEKFKVWMDGRLGKLALLQADGYSDQP